MSFSDYEIVHVSATFPAGSNSGSPYELVANAPAGKEVIGGGFYTSTPNEYANIRIFSSGPNGSDTSWTFWVITDNYLMTWHVYAICAVVS